MKKETGMDIGVDIRKNGSLGSVIVVTGLKDIKPGDEVHVLSLGADMVEWCCRVFSTRELREVAWRVTEQIGFNDPRCTREDAMLLNEVKDILAKRSDGINMPSFPFLPCYPKHTMRARIVRSSMGARIKVSGRKPNTEEQISNILTEHSCESFSVDELKEIVWQIEVGQLSSLDPNDTPPVYGELINKVKNVIRKREVIWPMHCFIHACPPIGKWVLVIE